VLFRIIKNLAPADVFPARVTNFGMPRKLDAYDEAISLPHDPCVRDVDYVDIRVVLTTASMTIMQQRKQRLYAGKHYRKSLH